MKYYALTLTDKIGEIDGFGTEEELDAFAIRKTSFSEAEQRHREAEGNTYGPPVVFVLLARDLDAVEENNYERPFAVYLRGERYDCVKRES